MTTMTDLKNRHKKEISSLMGKYGVFVSTSDNQFEEQRVEGVKYCAIDAGAWSPVDNAGEYLHRFRRMTDAHSAEIIREIPKRDIITYELDKQNCISTGEYSGAVNALQCYWIRPEEVEKVFWEELHKREEEREPAYSDIREGSAGAEAQ